MTAPPDATTRRCRAAVVALAVLHAAVLGWLAVETPWTSDENSYLMAGIALRSRLGFESSLTILHGPLPYYANQLAGLFGAGYEASMVPLPDNKVHGRLGMLVFALVALLAVARLAWRALGPRAAVAVAFLFACNPVLLAHGCLMTADMALTAATAVAVLACWRYLEAPGAGRAALLGASLGAAMATKYLAVLVVLALAAAVAGALAWRWWRVADRPRGLHVLRDAAACAAAALVAVHACYQFRAGFYDPVATPPGAALGALPLVADLARALPDPLVRGIDFQMRAGDAGVHAMFWDQVRPGHPLYFVAALVLKLPLALLALLAISASCRGPAHRLPWRLAWVVAATVLALLGYLSLGSKLQIGVRYVLPVVPLLLLLAVRPVEAWWRAPSPLPRAGLCLLLAGNLAATALAWPHLIGACNVLAGSRPYLLFGDSNIAWQMNPTLDPARAALHARHPDAGFVAFRSGPRFGPVIVHALELWPREAPAFGPVAHWLRRPYPSDREDSFLFFDLRAADYRALIRAADARGDGGEARRIRRDLVVAHLGAGEVAPAGDVLREDPAAATPELTAQLQALAATPPDRGAVRQGWAALGRFDLVLADPEAGPSERANAHFNRGEFRETHRILEAEHARRRLTWPELVQLTMSQVRDLAVTEALEVWREYEPPPGTDAHRAHTAGLARFEAAAESLRQLQAQIDSR